MSDPSGYVASDLQFDFFIADSTNEDDYEAEALKLVTGKLWEVLVFWIARTVLANWVVSGDWFRMDLAPTQVFTE